MKQFVFYLVLAVSLLGNALNALDDSARIGILYDKGVKELHSGDITSALEHFKNLLLINKESKNMLFEDCEYKIRAAEAIVTIYKNRNNEEGSEDHHIQKYSKFVIDLYDNAFGYAKAKNMPAKARKLAAILYDIFSKNGNYTSLDDKKYEIYIDPTKNGPHGINTKRADYYLNELDDAMKQKLNYDKRIQAHYLAQEGFEKLKQFNKGSKDSSVEGFDKTALVNLVQASMLDVTNYDVEYALAEMYLKGIGTKINVEVAREHIINALRIAQKINNEELIERAKKLKQEINPAYFDLIKNRSKTAEFITPDTQPDGQEGRARRSTIYVDKERRASVFDLLK